MMGHKICFSGEIWIMIPKIFWLPLPIWNTKIHSEMLHLHVVPPFLESKQHYFYEIMLAFRDNVNSQNGVWSKKTSSFVLKLTQIGKSDY